MTPRDQIHISSWPCIWPTRMLDDPSQAAGGIGDASAASAHSSVGAASAGSNGFLDESTIKTIVVGPLSSHRAVSPCSSIPRESQFKGFTLTESTREQQTREFVLMEGAVLYADIHLGFCVEGKQYHDGVDGYQRLDVLIVLLDAHPWFDPVHTLCRGHSDTDIGSWPMQSYSMNAFCRY
ncbi:hypothetical protein AnigIFM59636_008912 [Aspergillus niger]|uniref:uncharacterized protein n=1 Tax=Aspergillus lacticoffeatus (strain CBS 101883) TaxID=1450533 RepID=UPI000D7F157F|nr:uncharacterized protein BO96DRAFT_433249 [Aspergillus niger CBS 101883]PYH57801.1 hypothetical protein BO96DRAFT_433249 [Aspergillus niger CBS 101883]GJP87107.1 hypothetical protein AlacWU_00006 [Aspergillus niger]GKZ95173.1 hypothetical protein AnigIFM59636_008912 [Aspergillus niger]